MSQVEKYVYLVAYHSVDRDKTGIGFGRVFVDLTHPIQSVMDIKDIETELQRTTGLEIIVFNFQLLNTEGVWGRG